jgi:hypothetical protein
MVNSEGRLPPHNTRPRAARTFATLPEALDFLVHCLETNTPIGLLAELHDVSQQVGRSKAVIDRFKDVFMQLQTLHHQQDLRLRYQEANFPIDDDHYQLGGDLAQQGDLDIQFLRLERGWVLKRIDYL